MSRLCSKLSNTEKILLISSFILITVSYLLVPEKDILNLVASLTGAAALIYVSKGEPLGQIITVIFSLLYAIISYRFHYYGEMITYLGMTAPAALASVISWLKNPYQQGSSEVKVEKMNVKKTFILALCALSATVIFYFILKYFSTANLFFSTISITTSFTASGLTFLRSPSYALAYAANDIVLIIMWILATIENISFFPMIICFSVFLVNDIYGYINWKRMALKQRKCS